MSQYASLTAEITSSISKIGRLTSEQSENRDAEEVIEQDEKFKNIVNQVEKSFEDAEELFEQMELEIRELVDQSERTKNTTNLQSFKVREIGSREKNIQGRVLLKFCFLDKIL